MLQRGDERYEVQAAMLTAALSGLGAHVSARLRVFIDWVAEVLPAL